MQTLLPLFLLLSIGSGSSKLINSNNVSLTTELLAHIDDSKTQPSDGREGYNYKRGLYDLRQQKPNFHTLNNTLTHSHTDSETVTQDGTSNGIRGQLVPETPSMVLPFFPKPSLKKVVKHSLKALKMVALPSKLSEEYLPVIVLSSVIGTLTTCLVASLALSDMVFDTLRDHWAFQGEINGGSVETYTRMGVMLIAADLLFRTVVLRGVFYKNVRDSHFLTRVNWLGGNLGKTDHSLKYKVFTRVVEAASLAKTAVLTYLHYLMMENNWNTASFLVDEGMTKHAATVSYVFAVVTILHHLLNSVAYGTVSGFLNLEHLLDPLEFREKQATIKVYDELRKAYKNLPKGIANLVDPTTDILLSIYSFAELVEHTGYCDVDWAAMFLHAGMAFRSNSAAGIYLMFLEYLANFLNEGMSVLEKKLLSGKLFLYQ